MLHAATSVARTVSHGVTSQIFCRTIGFEMLRSLARLHDWTTQVGYYLSCLVLMIMLGAYTVEVFGRYFFNAPQWWASEAVSYSLCIGSFLMLPYVTWKRGHVAVTLIFDLLPKSAGIVLAWVTALMSVLACGLATWITFDETFRQYVQNVHIMAVEPVPKFLISVFIPLGFASTTLHFLRRLS